MFSNTSNSENVSEKSSEDVYSEADEDHKLHVDVRDEREGYQPFIEKTNDNKYKVIEITLVGTGSKEKDTRRLRQIYGILTSLPGNDQFAFLCKENGQTYRFDFPNDSTGVNDSLVNELNGMLGEVNVRVSS